MTLMPHQPTLERSRATTRHTSHVSKTMARKRRLNLSRHQATCMKCTNSSQLTLASEIKFSRSTRRHSSGTQTSTSRTFMQETGRIIRHVKEGSLTSPSTTRECRRPTSSHLQFARKEPRSFLTMWFLQSSQGRMWDTTFVWRWRDQVVSDSKHQRRAPVRGLQMPAWMWLATLRINQKRKSKFTSNQSSVFPNCLETDRSSFNFPNYTNN